MEQLRVSLRNGNKVFSALADVLYIFPFKADKKTFDENKDELGFSSKIKVAKYKKTEGDLERERL